VGVRHRCPKWSPLNHSKSYPIHISGPPQLFMSEYDFGASQIAGLKPWIQNAMTESCALQLLSPSHLSAAASVSGRPMVREVSD